MYKLTVPPIGQGCCIEQQASIDGEHIRILYDCGSYQRKSLYSYIDSLDTSIKTILVVSHLHIDHTNGIPHLYDHFKKHNEKIFHLYMPYYREEERKFFAASILNESTEDETRLIEQVLQPYPSYPFIDFATSVTYILAGGKEEPDDLVKPNFLHCHKGLNISLNTRKLEWMMNFWVDDSVYMDLSHPDLSKIQAFCEGDFSNPIKHKEIVAIYRQLANKIDFNKTSMIMATYFRKNCPFSTKGVVCTGDYPFSDKPICNEIHNYYEEEQQRILTAIVPHHGGKDDCLFMPFDYIQTAYAQNGRRNKYNHPGNITIDNLRKWGIDFKNIQEPENAPDSCAGTAK
jgi:hypothetical protein